MDLAAAAGEGGDITADQAGHTTDEGAENVDREALQEARNKMNEILSHSNPRELVKCDYYTVTLFYISGDSPEKTADILRRYHWFSRQMMSEKRA